MSANIQTLITKSDNFELIRDEIAAILAVEIANQKALATIAEADTTLYDFDLFTERSDPWNLFFNDFPSFLYSDSGAVYFGKQRFDEQGNGQIPADD